MEFDVGVDFVRWNVSERRRCWPERLSIVQTKEVSAALPAEKRESGRIAGETVLMFRRGLQTARENDRKDQDNSENHGSFGLPEGMGRGRVPIAGSGRQSWSFPQDTSWSSLRWRRIGRRDLHGERCSTG